MLAQSGHDDHGRRVELLVQRWLQERQALITQLRQLGEEAQRPVASVPPASLQAFCEILMDYVSAGHFEVYDELLAEANRRSGSSPPLGQTLLEQLQPTTDAVLRFNDLCEDRHDAVAQADLVRELSLLAPELERRFETEDRLIALLGETSGRAPA